MRVLAVIGGLLAAVDFACAADLPAGPAPAPVPVYAPAAPPPGPDWTGPYIGLGFGVRYDAVDGNVTSATVGTPPTAIPLPSVSAPESSAFEWWGSGHGSMQYYDNVALRAGFYGGYNYQIARTYVVGVEADFSFVNETNVVQGSPYPAVLQFGSPSLVFGSSNNDGLRVTTTWDGSARLRGGWLVTPSTMLFLTGGVAWTHLDTTSTCSTVPTPNVSNCAPGNYFSGTLSPSTISHSETVLGWTGGVGVDILLSAHWVARAEYRFSDFGAIVGRPFSATDIRTCTGCSSASTSPLTVSYDLPMMQHIFQFGVAYKF